MVRSRWPDGVEGLFFPDCRSVHTFFTFLNPDLVFLDKNGKILRIVSSASAWRLYFGPSDCRDTLELPAGGAQRLGLRPGVAVQFSFLS